MSLKSMICVSSASAGHMEKVGDWLRSARGNNDTRGTNVEITCADRVERAHFDVLAAHSAYFRQLLETHNLPVRVEMVGCKPEAVANVIDWMYSGTLKFMAQELGDYFCVSTALAMHSLHGYLEKILVQLAMRPCMRLFCLNIASDSRYKISNGTQESALEHFVNERTTLSSSNLLCLSVAAVIALVSSQSLSFANKLDVINLAIVWLSVEQHRRCGDEVLNALRVEQLEPSALQALVSRLKELLARNEFTSVHVYSNDGRSVEVAYKVPKDSSMRRDPLHSDSSKLGSGKARRMCRCRKSGVFVNESPSLNNTYYKPFSATSNLAKDSDKKTHRCYATDSIASPQRKFDLGYRCYITSCPAIKQPAVGCLEKQAHSHSNESSLDAARRTESPISRQEKVTLPAASSKTVNRYGGRSDESVAGIYRLPDSFSSTSCSTESQRNGRKSVFSEHYPKSTDDITPLQLPLSHREMPHRQLARSSESIAEIDRLPDIVHVPEKSVSRRSHCSESIAEIEKLPDTFSSRGRHQHCEESVAEIAQLPSFFERSDRKPHIHCEDSVAEIKQLPDFFDRSGRYSTNHCDESVVEIKELPDFFDRCGRQRHDHCEESVAEIKQLPDFFSRSGRRGRDYSEESVAEIKILPDFFSQPGRQRYDHCEESVAEVKQLPDFFNPSGRQRHDHCEESVAEIKQLPDFFDRSGRQRHNRCEESVAEIKQLPDFFDRSGRERHDHCEESVAEIKNLPDLFDKSGRQRHNRCEESVAEIKQLPDFFDRSGSQKRYDHCEESVAEIKHLPDLFDKSGRQRHNRCEESVAEIKQLPDFFDRSGRERHDHCEESVAEIKHLPDLFDKSGRQHHNHCEESVAEIKLLPDCFDRLGRQRHSHCEESVAEMKQLPDFFGHSEMSDPKYSHCAESVSEISFLPDFFCDAETSKSGHNHCRESVIEISQLPDVFCDEGRWNVSVVPSNDSINEILQLPDFFFDGEKPSGAHTRCSESIYEISQLPDFFCDSENQAKRLAT